MCADRYNAPADHAPGSLVADDCAPTVHNLPPFLGVVRSGTQHTGGALGNHRTAASQYRRQSCIVIVCASQFDGARIATIELLADAVGTVAALMHGELTSMGRLLTYAECLIDVHLPPTLGRKTLDANASNRRGLLVDRSTMGGTINA